MRLPLLLGLGRKEAVNKRLAVNGLGPRCVDGAQHEIHTVRRKVGPFEGAARLVSPCLQVVGGGGGHLNFDAFDIPLFLLPLAIATNALRGRPVRHGVLLDARQSIWRNRITDQARNRLRHNA